MYRVTHGTAPLYLVELCQPCSDTRLRSASRSDYNDPVLTGVLLTVPSLSLPPMFGIVCLAISVAHLLSYLFLPGSRPTFLIPHFLPFSTEPNLIL